MAKQITEKVSVNGWLNLLAQARADGYSGQAIIKGGVVVNPNATVAYFHATDNGATNPSTGADGLPFGTTSSTAPSAAIALVPGTDISCVWIFTSGAQDIKYGIIGG